MSQAQELARVMALAWKVDPITGMTLAQKAARDALADIGNISPALRDVNEQVCRMHNATPAVRMAVCR